MGCQLLEETSTPLTCCGWEEKALVWRPGRAAATAAVGSSQDG